LSGGAWSEDWKTFTVPYSGLSSGTTYTVHISGFRDLVDSVLPEDNSHTFTTIGAAPEVLFPVATAIPYGVTLSTSTLSGGTSGRGTFAWLDGTPVPPVTTGYTVVFTPSDADVYDYSAVSGWDASTQTVQRTVSITVNPAPLTVTPNSGQTKVYGEPDPPLTFTVSGWKRGDEADSAAILTGALSREPGESVGTYSILQNTLLSASGSYTLVFVENIPFTISKEVSNVEVSGTSGAGEHHYVVDNPATKVITITVSPDDSSAKVLYNGKEVTGTPPSFTVNVTRGGTHEVSYTVVAPDGTQQTYTITVEQRLNFDTYVRLKGHNIIVCNNRLLTKNGYVVSGIRWYGDGVLLTEDTYYALSEWWMAFSPSVAYHFEIDTPEGVIRSTDKTFDFSTGISDAKSAPQLSPYPNPLPSGATLNVYTGEWGTRSNELLIYNASGSLVLRRRFSGAFVSLPFFAPAGIYFLHAGSKYGTIMVK
jgi:hypothetical protein